MGHENQNSEKPAELTLERAKELLNACIDYLAIAENTRTQLETLFRIGFTERELVDVFHYSQSDVDEYLSEDSEAED